LIQTAREEKGIKLDSLRIAWAVAFMASFSYLFIAYVSIALAESLSANPGYVYVNKGETKALIISGGNFRRQCGVASNDPPIATAQFDRISKKLQVTGVSAGQTKIALTDSDSDSVTIRIRVFSIHMSTRAIT
jgi:hypothetical protein